MKDNLIYIAFSKNENKSGDALVEAIKNAFYSQAGNVTVCESLGCLEIARAQIISEIAI